MTDARFPDRWLTDRRIQRLSPGHYRGFGNALMWMVANRTDGAIGPDDLCMVPHLTPDTPGALVAAGLWEEVSDGGWRFVAWESTQTTRSEHEALERVRAREREKKARQRAALGDKNSAPTGVPGTHPRDKSPGQAAGNYRQDRQDRQDSFIGENQATEGGDADPPAVCRECRSRPAQGDPHPLPDLCAGCMDESKHPTMQSQRRCIDCESQPAAEGLRRCRACERSHQTLMAGYDR